MTGQQKAVSVVAHRTALGTNEATPRQFSFPSPGSVKARVLADLLKGLRITHLDVWLSHGSSRAAHHILKLREGGWPIETDTVDAPTRDGRTARIAEYWLPREVVNRDPIAVRQFLQAVRGDA